MIAIPGHKLIGDPIFFLAIFPILVISWELGLLAGTGASLAVTLLHLSMHEAANAPVYQMTDTRIVLAISGLATMLGVSAATAWLRRVSANASHELGERNRAHAELRESEHKFHLVFDTMTEAIAITELIYDEQGKVSDWIIVDTNPAYKKFASIPHAAVIGKRASELYSKTPVFLQVLEQLEAAAASDQPIRIKFDAQVAGRDLDITARALEDGQVAIVTSDITEQVRAMEAEREQRRMAEALRDISAALTGTLELDGVLDRILLNIHKIASYDAVNIMLIEHGRVRVVRHFGYHNRGLENYISTFNKQVEEVHGLRWMCENQRPLIIPNTLTDQSWLVFPPTKWIHSYAGIPIQVRGEMIGFLNLNSSTPDFFLPDDIDRLQPFADQAALAILNARAYEDTQRRARRLALINRVAHMLNQPMELKNVIQVTVDCMAEALHVPQVALAMFNSARDRLTIMADHPAPGSELQPGPEVPLENNLAVAQVLRDHTWYLAENAAEDPNLFALREILKLRGTHSMLILPILMREEVIGTITCDLTDPGRRFTEEEIDLAETITDLAAVRIEQARLFAEERKRASELALLHITSLDITMHNDLPTLLKTIVERAAWLMNASGGTLYLVDPERQELVCKVCHNLRHDEIGTVTHFGEGAVGRVAESGTSLIIPDYGRWPHHLISEEQAGGFLAVASVPVTWQGRVKGVIQLTRTDPQLAFTQTDINLLELFSNQVAISLENTRLYNEIQQIAIEDTLTGLYNRRGLHEIGQREIERAQRFQRPLSMLMLDIDHFKVVNDTFGHPIGDEVLAWVARRIRQHLRSIDIACRYGGEEFVVLLLENNLSAAGSAASRICRMIAQTPAPTSVGDISVTISIGAVMLDGSMQGLPDLIRAADEALYQAKHSGRNQVRYFEPAFQNMIFDEDALLLPRQDEDY